LIEVVKLGKLIFNIDASKGSTGIDGQPIIVVTALFIIISIDKGFTSASTVDITIPSSILAAFISRIFHCTTFVHRTKI